MTALDRLLAEALPTGTFGDAQPMRAPRVAPRQWTREEQVRHYAELADAIGAPLLRVVEPVTA